MHVVGTAGHVDHGKSTLVQALTGIHPDRLKEEREREMTIDPGFAWLTLPNDEEVGIVDVPGHRDFIENMQAGVGGIDAALFVVAADEGIMPQTREHLAILDLLQIRGGVVALTKIDLVDDPEWLDLVEEEFQEVVTGTVLEAARIVGEAILEQPLVIALLAVPILIQVFFNSSLAYVLNRAVGEKHNIACPSALIGASNFFELTVAAAISLFGFESGAALATVVGVLIEVPVMLLVVRVVNSTKGWYERTT